MEALNTALGALLTSMVGVPGSEAVVAPDVIFGTLGIPIPPLNTVIGARFAPEIADGRIEGVLGWFAERKMPVVWWVGPDDEPRDLGRPLIEHGLVRDKGFGAPSEFGEALAQMAIIGFADDVPQRTYLARLDGRPVATALGVRAGEVLGIFNVAPLPDARGRGLGRAVTVAAMHDGVAEGCRVGVLQSSEMGHRVYERLGFTDFCEFELTYAPRGSEGPEPAHTFAAHLDA